MLDRILRFVFESKAFREAVRREAMSLHTATTIAEVDPKTIENVTISGRVVHGPELDQAVKRSIASGAANDELDRLLSESLR